jgi:hypothetical protein
LLGAYTRAEDDAMTLAFGGWGKKMLNRVFDVIGFVYPDYTYPSRKQGKKRKTAASATSVVPKGKKIKVLAHRPRYIEKTMVPKLDEQSAPIDRSAEESAEVPKVPATGSAEASKHTTEAKGKAAKEPDREETTGPQKIFSPPPESKLSKGLKAPAITPKRRRMASVLDAVMESTRALTPAPANKIAEAATARAEIEAGPSVPAETAPAGTGQRTGQWSLDAGLALEKKDAPEKVKSPTPEAPSEDLDFIIRHASGKRLSEEEITEAKHYAWELKYSKGGLGVQWHRQRWFLILSPRQQRNIRLPGDGQKYGIFEAWSWPLCHVEGWPRRQPCIQQSEGTEVMDLKINCLVFYSHADPLSFFLQGLILSNALRAQKNAEDESC